MLNGVPRWHSGKEPTCQCRRWKRLAVMSLLCEYDYLGKGGDGAATTPDQLLVELVAKILNV